MAKEETTTKAKASTKEAAEPKAPRGIILKVDGKDVPRVEYIRELARSGKYTRGEIATKVSELQGTKVPYQIVFAATKGQADAKFPVREKEAKPAAEAKAKGKEKAA